MGAAPADSAAALANVTSFDRAANFTPPRRRILWIENTLDCRTWTYYCDIRDAMAKFHDLCVPVAGTTCLEDRRKFRPDYAVVGPRYTANIAHDDETLGFDRRRYAQLPLVILQNKMYAATTREIVGDAKAKLKWAQETGAVAAFTWLTQHREFTKQSGVPHFWMPFGVDVALYGRRAEDEAVNQPYDIGFTGASNGKYPLREAVLQLIRSMNVSSYLGTWAQTSLHQSHNMSWKALDRTGYAAQLRRAKMWVSTTGPSNIVGTRYFEVLATGTTLLLCNRPPKGVWVYDGLFEDGVHTVMFDDMDDLKAKIIFYLKNEDERLRIVSEAARLVRRIHSWESRARFISQVVELVVPRTRKDNQSRSISYAAQGPSAAFMGCYDMPRSKNHEFTEQKVRRILRRHTVATCAQTCKSKKGTKLFAMECGGFCSGNGHRLGRCFCGASKTEIFSHKRRPRATCAMPCSLHDPRPCGGNGVLAIYSFDSQAIQQALQPRPSRNNGLLPAYTRNTSSSHANTATT